METEAPDPRDPLWAASRGVVTAWIVHLGRRHGLWRALDGAPRAPADLARTLDLAEDPLATWCDAAEALDLLERSEAGYRVPPDLAPRLARPGTADDLAGHLSYLVLRGLDLHHADVLLREGRPQPPTEHLREAVEAATAWDHAAYLDAVVPESPRLLARLTSGGEVLDVGAGVGEWARRVAEAYPHLRITGVDPDEDAVSRARELASDHPARDRLRFFAGTVEDLAPGAGFDLVHLGEVLSQVPDPGSLLAACRDHLQPGGLLTVAEGLETPAADRDPVGHVLLRALQVDFALQGTRFLGRDELLALLAEAGFVEVELHPLGGGFFVAVAGV